MSKLLKVDYKIVTPLGEVIFTEAGKKSDSDMKIFTKFPKTPWPHSLYYIAVCLRLKSIVEDRNYPNGRGKHMLLNFCQDAILTADKKKDNYKSISDICKKYQIPER